MGHGDGVGAKVSKATAHRPDREGSSRLMNLRRRGWLPSSSNLLSRPSPIGTKQTSGDVRFYAVVGESADISPPSCTVPIYESEPWRDVAGTWRGVSRAGQRAAPRPAATPLANEACSRY